VGVSRRETIEEENVRKRNGQNPAKSMAPHGRNLLARGGENSTNNRGATMALRISTDMARVGKKKKPKGHKA